MGHFIITIAIRSWCDPPRAIRCAGLPTHLESGAINTAVPFVQGLQHMQTDREAFLSQVKNLQNGHWLSQVRYNGYAPRYVSVEDRLRQGWVAYMSTRPRADIKRLRAELKRHWTGWRSARPELQADPTAVLLLAATTRNGRLWISASTELRGDKEAVLAAVKQCGLALHLALEELRADKEVVLAAVKQCGYALTFASKQLRADPATVLAAVRQDEDALKLASEELQADTFLQRCARESNLSPLCRFVLARHRQLKASLVAAQVDVWMIRNGHDAFSHSCKQQRVL